MNVRKPKKGEPIPDVLIIHKERSLQGHPKTPQTKALRQGRHDQVLQGSGETTDHS